MTTWNLLSGAAGFENGGGLSDWKGTEFNRFKSAHRDRRNIFPGMDMVRSSILQTAVRTIGPVFFKLIGKEGPRARFEVPLARPKETKDISLKMFHKKRCARSLWHA